MQKEQNDSKTSPQTAKKINTSALDGLGLRFSGMITGIGDVKPWTKNNQKEELGQKIDLQISDGKKGYTYSYKVPTGSKFAPLQMLQIIEIKEVRVMEDMGLARLLGELVA